MGMNIFGMLGLTGNGRTQTQPADNQAASLVAARNAALGKQKGVLSSMAGSNSLNATSPLGITGPANTPAGYKTLLGS